MKLLRECSKRYKYVYFYTGACYGRPADTIIIRIAITPTGRESKWWATIRLNGKVFGENVSEETLQKYATPEKMKLPKLPNGYTWSEPYLY